MKKTILLIFGLILVIPHFALASWWNPLTWFKQGNDNTKIEESNNHEWQRTLSSISATSTPSQVTKFYIKFDNSRVRSCASTTGCNVLGYYQKNQVIELTGSNLTLKDLDDWITMNYTDGPIGYLHKSVLSEAPVSITTITPKNLPVISNTKSSSSLEDENPVIVTIDANIKQNIDAIESIKSDIVDVKKDIEFSNKTLSIWEDTVNNAPKNSFDDSKYKQFALVMIEAHKNDIKYYEEVITHFTNIINILGKNIAIAQQNRKLFESKVYKGNDWVKDTTTFFEQKNRDMDLLFAVHDVYGEYVDYRKTQNAIYKKGLDTFIQVLNRDRDNLSSYTPPTYVPRPIPAIPVLQIPKATYCNVRSGIGSNYTIICN